jgi:hypothetical protein
MIVLAAFERAAATHGALKASRPAIPGGVFHALL